MAAKLIALYKTPVSPSDFDAHYEKTHIPTAKKVPGLRGYEVSSGAVQVGQGKSPYHLVAILSFDSLAAIQSALESPEGKATADDLANFAQAGVELLMFETKEV